MQQQHCCSFNEREGNHQRNALDVADHNQNGDEMDDTPDNDLTNGNTTAATTVPEMDLPGDGDLNNPRNDADALDGANGMEVGLDGMEGEEENEEAGIGVIFANGREEDEDDDNMDDSSEEEEGDLPDFINPNVIVNGINYGRRNHCTTLQIQEGLQHLPKGALRDCPRLKTLTLPNTLLSVGAWKEAFSWIVIPSG